MNSHLEDVRATVNGVGRLLGKGAGVVTKGAGAAQSRIGSRMSFRKAARAAGGTAGKAAGWGLRNLLRRRKRLEAPPRVAASAAPTPQPEKIEPAETQRVKTVSPMKQRKSFRRGLVRLFERARELRKASLRARVKEAPPARRKPEAKPELAVEGALRKSEVSRTVPAHGALRGEEARHPLPETRRESASHPLDETEYALPQTSEPESAFEEPVGGTVRTIESSEEGEREARPRVEPLPANLILQGIDFENSMDAARAEVYVKDFASQLPKVRAAALDAITKLPKPASVEILKRLLVTKKDPLEVMEVLDALSSVNEEGTIEKRIFKDYLSHPQTYLRLAAVRAFSKYKDEESFAILSVALKDKDPEIRRRALSELYWTYGARSELAALKLLHDPDWQVQKTAVSICVQLKLSQSISALITLLSEPDKNVEKCAIDALTKITGQSFGFRPNGSAKQKKEAVEAWRFWWRDNQASFRSLT